jgi:hypothetical protein
MTKALIIETTNTEAISITITNATTQRARNAVLLGPLI